MGHGAGARISTDRLDEINNEDELDDESAEPPLIPATESQARELAPLLDDPEELREVWTETVERTEGKPTAAAIRASRKLHSDGAGAAWSVRVYYKPFVVWIWGGALLMALGGGVAAADKRYRLKKRQAALQGAFA